MISTTDHFENLEHKYIQVGSQTWHRSDFDINKINISRNFFTPESLNNRSPVPKSLEVFALLSGLPFEDSFCNELISIQNQLSEILDDTLVYWVKPKNLAVEHCVFKWPTDNWDESWLPIIIDAIRDLKQSSFNFHVKGIQINPDGCVVAKGFDENSLVFKIRDTMLKKLKFMPQKQSNWAHVPLGRILENVNHVKFQKLHEFIANISFKKITDTHINSLKFIHEHQWYMENRNTLFDFNLNS